MRKTIFIISLSLLYSFGCNRPNEQQFEGHLLKRPVLNIKKVDLIVYRVDNAIANPDDIENVGNRLLDDKISDNKEFIKRSFFSLNQVLDFLNDSISALDSRIKIDYLGISMYGVPLGEERYLFLSGMNNTLVFIDKQNEIYQAMCKDVIQKSFDASINPVIYILDEKLFPVVGIKKLEPKSKLLQCEKYLYNPGDGNNFKARLIQVQELQDASYVSFPLTNTSLYHITEQSDTLIFKGGGMFRDIPLWVESGLYGAFVRSTS